MPPRWLLWNFTADDANGAHHTAKLIAANGLAVMGSATWREVGDTPNGGVLKTGVF